MLNHTLRKTISQSFRDLAQARESQLIAAQKAARLRADAVATVSRSYNFSRDDDQCFLTPNKTPVQMAMKLISRAAPAETLTVIARADDEGSLLWFITDMQHARFDAGIYIEAVQNRIEQNAQARTEANGVAGNSSGDTRVSSIASLQEGIEPSKSSVQ